jgi:UDP-N-acetylmuramoylalanine--D-glutamate ligase
LFDHQTTDDFAVYFSKNKLSEEIASEGKGRKIPYYEKPGAVIENGNLVIGDKAICSVKSFKLPGEHNWQNMCAATTALWQVENNTKAIEKVATSFSGLPYRLELVREVEGVKYYNDSFGTTPETAQVAIKAFSQPEILILGGSDKGSDYNGLAKTIAQNNVKKVLLIGKMAEKIRTELDKTGYRNYIEGGKSIEEIVQNAANASEPGDIVLFSTACASFDMFKNYKDRGDKFTRAVIELS